MELASRRTHQDGVPLVSGSNKFAPFGLKNSDWFLIKCALIVGGGGLVYGYDIGVISGALTQLEDEFQLGSAEKGLVVACLPLGSVFGCLFGGSLCDYIGRWRTVILQNIMYIGGALLISGSTTVGSLYAGRFVVGIGTALSGIADVPYLTEISPPHHRGRLSSAYEFLAVIGILAAYVVNFVLRDMKNGWRLLFAIPAIFAFLQAAFMWFLPETPKWLIQNGQEAEGRKALQQACDTESEVNERFKEIVESHHHSSNITADFKEAFNKTTFNYRWVFAAIIILMIFQQFTGGAVVRNYAPHIFKQAGFRDDASLKFTIVLGVVKVIAVGWSIWKVDCLGRKKLLLVGIGIMSFGQLVLAIAFSTGYGDNISVFVVACAMILGGFSVGLGPITWLLQAEMFPTIIRGRAMGVSVIFRNLSEFMVNLAFLPLTDTIGDEGAFGFFFIMCLLALAFVYVILVETKGKEPEEILAEFIATSKENGRGGNGSYMNCFTNDEEENSSSSVP